jgi:hypothetical protein
MLALPGTHAVGIDPEPDITWPVEPGTEIYSTTSDEFFANNDLSVILGGLAVDLSFIDGMHHFEFSLRDFMNLEKYSTAQSTVLIHDCYPIDKTTSTRDGNLGIWSGDVWKLILALKEFRPDLKIYTVDVAPTGLGIIRGLDSGSTVLEDNYDKIIERYLTMPYEVVDRDKPRTLNRVPPDWTTVRGLLPDQPFRSVNPTWLFCRRAARYAPHLLLNLRLGRSKQRGAGVRAYKFYLAAPQRVRKRAR